MQAREIGVTRSPSSSERSEDLAEEVQQHPAEEGCPYHLRDNQRDGKP